MLLNLKNSLLQPPSEPTLLTITERLPDAIVSPCTVNINYKLKAIKNYYIMDLHITGTIHLVCQRCLSEFEHEFLSDNTLAICDNELEAEKYLDEFESIIVKDGYIDLEAIVTDELHLYSPLNHPSIEQCDKEVIQFIS